MRKEQIITTNNNQMEEKGMKSRFVHFKKRFVPALSGALMGVMLMSQIKRPQWKKDPSHP